MVLCGKHVINWAGMEKLLSSTESYLKRVLGDAGWPVPWQHAGGLPAYLQERYEFALMGIAQVDCLLMLQRGDDMETPSVIRKHMEAVRRAECGPVVYVAATVTSYERQRLIDQKVPFVVPGKQMYLPPLGIDLREQFAPVRSKARPLGAVAQILVLREILQPGFSAAPSGYLAEQLGYSAMSLVRATTELAESELAEVERVGREKHTAFLYEGRKLWEKASTMLSSPLRKRVWVNGTPSMLSAPAAGESALAHYTMMAEPRHPTVAMNSKDWPGQKALLQLEEVPERWEGSLCVELWRYSPRLVQDAPWVDRLSLWLSLQGSRDERIEMAMDDLLSGVEW